MRSGGLRLSQISASSQTSAASKGDEMIRRKNALLALLICMMILACVSIVGWSNRSQAASKIVWEYKIFNTSVEPPPSPMADPESGLKLLGIDGWELVQFSRGEISETRGIWIFKRPK
jgi:hypothetical protein